MLSRSMEASGRMGQARGEECLSSRDKRRIGNPKARLSNESNQTGSPKLWQLTLGRGGGKGWLGPAGSTDRAALWCPKALISASSGG